MTFYFLLFVIFCQYRNKNPPRITGGDFSFGHSPNNTGCAQVRLLLACQPRNCYLLPVNGLRKKPSSGRKGDRLRWKEPAKTIVLPLASFQLHDWACACSLSLAFARQLPPGGSLWHKVFLRWFFICFLLNGKAFMEPRHYGGVFGIQKTTAK